MGLGKQINSIGKSNLNMNSVSDMITYLACRLKTNLYLIDNEKGTKKYYDLQYLNTHELRVEHANERGRWAIYEYRFLDNFLEFAIFPSGFFEIEVEYNGAWSLFIEDLEMNFCYNKNKNAFLAQRNEALEFLQSFWGATMSWFYQTIII